MMHLGLVGYPLDHSLSPRIHAAALRASGLQGSYALFPVPAADKQGLNDLLARVRSAEITGLNVTIPHKRNVIPFLDDLTFAAQAIGAVNTLSLRDNKLIGDNTDAPGFLCDLCQLTGRRERRTENRRSALILGAGGSARAVAYALIQDGWTLAVAARRTEQARQLAKSFPDHKVLVTDHRFSDIDSTGIGLVVNATPVGMAPNTDSSPWPEGVPFPPSAAVYDLVYDPHETKLVRDARAAGLSARNGLGMLIEQAALAFEIWTGCNPPRDVLRQAIEY
jgi:shikimate dehydrogenase